MTIEVDRLGHQLLTNPCFAGNKNPGIGGRNLLDQVINGLHPVTFADNVSKGALNQFSRSIAVEYGASGIRSNSICPGLIATDMTADLMKDADLMKEWSKEYPIGRFGKPEDVANACLYLASDESSFVTGITLPVDGGFTAH